MIKYIVIVNDFSIGAVASPSWRSDQGDSEHFLPLNGPVAF